MMVSNKAESDIGYVRDLVKKSERRPTPTSIYLLWAGIVLFGFAMVDFFPRQTGYYWMIMGPLGGLVSGLLGRRDSESRGQLNREIGIRHALHWGALLVLTGFVIVLAVTDHIAGDEIGRVILLIVTFGWWTAGVHFDRVFLWLGGLMALGFVGTLIFPIYVWTSLGVTLAIALTVIALRKGRSDVAETH
ncbi:hypothetical protein ACFL6M_05900 [Candidatus Eisenbacteria bacterium]|uniref:DUF308 domain-containing protein n=1 Tax=Eiseniibacteriota bacterium TaxID=2212470 RepID=A0ABV6YLA8_UNCEI